MIDPPGEAAASQARCTLSPTFTDARPPTRPMTGWVAPRGRGPHACSHVPPPSPASRLLQGHVSILNAAFTFQVERQLMLPLTAKQQPKQDPGFTRT